MRRISINNLINTSLPLPALMNKIGDITTTIKFFMSRADNSVVDCKTLINNYAIIANIQDYLLSNDMINPSIVDLLLQYQTQMTLTVANVSVQPDILDKRSLSAWLAQIAEDESVLEVLPHSEEEFRQKKIQLAVCIDIIEAPLKSSIVEKYH